VSWGTKGSDKMEALPSLKVEKEASGEVVVKDIQRVRSHAPISHVFGR